MEAGVPVHYEDKSDPYEEYLKEMELDKENDKPGYAYYDNSETKWDKVYVYWWGGMSVNSITKEPYYYADWPGFEMERIEGTDIYRAVAPFGVIGIIFDSGVSDKEVSEGKTAYQTTDLPYSNAMIGKIYKIDMFVIEQVAKDLNKMKESGIGMVPISVNLSRQDFDREQCMIFEYIEEILEEYDVPKDMLDIEITESVLGQKEKILRKELKKFTDWQALERHLLKHNILDEFVRFADKKGVNAQDTTLYLFSKLPPYWSVR